jgi:hypothetical protein
MMPRSTILILVTTLGAVSLSAAADTFLPTPIRPGYWSTTNEVTSPVHRSKTENRCITAAAISKFLGCYINHHYQCSCPEQSSTGGRIIFRGDCVDAKGGHVQIDGEGSYTPTSLQMAAHGRAKVLGFTVPFATTTNSHWLADICPPGTPGSDGR